MMFATEAPVLAETTWWVGSVLIPLVVALGTSGVVSHFLQRKEARKSRRRDGYAEAVAAVVAWIEYPFRVRRRTSDNPETLDALTGTAHDIQERLAYSAAWIASDDSGAHTAYSELTKAVKATAGPLLQEAWGSAPVQSASEMNLNGWGASQSELAHSQVRRFLDVVGKRVR